MDAILAVVIPLIEQRPALFVASLALVILFGMMLIGWAKGE